MLSPVIDKTSLKVLSYKAKDAIVDFHIASVCSLSAYDVSSFTTDSEQFVPPFLRYMTYIPVCRVLFYL